MFANEHIELVCYTYNYDILEITKFGNHLQERYDNIVELLKKSWNLYVKNKGSTNKVVFKRIYIRDQYYTFGDYCFSIMNESQLDECFPNFAFNSWNEARIKDYKEEFNNLIEEGTKPYSDNRAFWIGNTLSHPSRNNFEKLTTKYPDLVDFRYLDWNNPHNYVSLRDHCKYRVLVDIRGWGHSGRLPLLLATGRPVIVGPRVFEQWFYFDNTFLPWVHYIPAGEKIGETFNFDDIIKAVQWTVDNPEKAAEIGKAGQAYAQKYLTQDAILEKIGDIMIKEL
jgi:hypothetical protein